MNVDEPLAKEWIVRSDSDKNAYSVMTSTVRSLSMTRSMLSRTNSFLRNLNNRSAARLENG